MAEITTLHQEVKWESFQRCYTVGLPTLITTLALTVIFASGMTCLIPGVNTMSVVMPVIVPCSVIVAICLPFFACYCRESTKRADLLDMAKSKLTEDLPRNITVPENDDETHPNAPWILDTILLSPAVNDVYNRSFLNDLKKTFPEENKTPREKEISEALDAAISELNKKDVAEDSNEE